MSSETDTASGPAPGSDDNRIKFLVVADASPEALLAAFFAGRRARRSGARVAILAVVEPPEFGHWASVVETMRAEARDRAEALMADFAAEVKAQAGEDPEVIIREGTLVDELRGMIEEDELISFLFLGASSEQTGPGPLVASLARGPQTFGARPIPIVVVPGSASRDDLRKLSG